MQVSFLEERILTTDLSHISGDRLVSGSVADMCNLVELVGTLCALNEAEKLPRSMLSSEYDNPRHLLGDHENSLYSLHEQHSFRITASTHSN